MLLQRATVSKKHANPFAAQYQKFRLRASDSEGSIQGLILSIDTRSTSRIDHSSFFSTIPSFTAASLGIQHLPAVHYSRIDLPPPWTTPMAHTPLNRQTSPLTTLHTLQNRRNHLTTPNRNSKHTSKRHISHLAITISSPSASNLFSHKINTSPPTCQGTVA